LFFDIDIFEYAKPQRHPEKGVYNTCHSPTEELCENYNDGTDDTGAKLITEYHFKDASTAKIAPSVTATIFKTVK
jgi:hypothetical protein